MLDVNAHLVVLGRGGAFTGLADVVATAEAVDPEVESVAPMVFLEVTVASSTVTSRPVLLKGAAAGRARIQHDFGHYVVAGSFDGTVGPDGKPPVVLGDVLARELQVGVGDLVAITRFDEALAEAAPTPAVPVQGRVTALLHFDFPEYDRGLLLTTLAGAQQVANRGDTVMGVELRLRHPDQALRVKKALEARLGETYLVIDWCELNRHFLRC